MPSASTLLTLVMVLISLFLATINSLLVMSGVGSWINVVAALLWWMGFVGWGGSLWYRMADR